MRDPTTSFRMSEATENDRGAIRTLLKSAGLPTETLEHGPATFFVAKEGELLSAVAGFEFYGTDALLRSVCVDAVRRKSGIGTLVVNWMLAEARERGVGRIYLLTETAEGFFRQQGFAVVDRSTVDNPALRQSSEFTSACPTSAVCMELKLAPAAAERATKTNILVLCTGNSCRSQMAEGFLKSYDTRISVASAGTHPADRVHPLAVQVMKEVGVDISAHRPKPVDRFLSDTFDYVVTVCNDAAEACPAFAGAVRKRLHFSFDDPAALTVDAEAALKEFRRVRDEIRLKFHDFYQLMIRKELDHGNDRKSVR